MTDENNPTVVAFFKCVKSTKRIAEGGGTYYTKLNPTRDEVITRCYIKKFDKAGLEGCFKSLKNEYNSSEIRCDYIGREYLD